MDDQARRALRDIERDLRRDDPAFAARMSGEGPHFPILSALCAGLYIAIPIVGLLFGLFPVVVITYVAVVVVVVVLIRRRRRRREAASDPY